MKKRHLILIIILSGLTIFSNAQNFSKDKLIYDIRQLSSILEESHPDPYFVGGGKIAYNERLHKLMLSIPDTGMEKNEFQRLLLPFVASIGDGHTRIHVSYKKNNNQPGGIPLLFKIIENTLYVAGVVNSNDEYLIGSLLLSVENIPFQEIYERVIKLRGVDNEYGGLTLLEGMNYLWHKEQIEHLIPELKDKDQINVKLRLPDNKEKIIAFGRDDKLDNSLTVVKSTIQIPDTKKSEFNYRFIEKRDTKIAVLKIDGMVGFRENFELGGLENEYQLKRARQYYNSYNEVEPPENKSAIIQGIPSATDQFKSMVIEMKKSKTEILIIDLRENGGGNSTLGQFLTYFLYGKDALIGNLSNQSGYEIKKLSNLYFEENKGDKIDEINATSKINLTENDYWFEEFYSNDSKKDSIEQYTEFDNFYQKIPTFYNEYKTGKYSKYYCPPEVFVLCSPKTYSSGFTMMKNLHELGAILVGTPSSQAGNNPGWILNYKLDNTELTGWVACKYYTSFSKNFRNRVYVPDYMLTYKKLLEYNFDPNSELLYTLELIDE